MALPVTLKINGSSVDLSATACEVGALRRGYAAPATLTMRRSIAFDDTATWQNEDDVELWTDDGTHLFTGKIKANSRRASTTGEEISYQCVGLREQVAGVTFRKSISGSTMSRVVYNCPNDEEESESGHVALTGRRRDVGEIIADILDAAASDLNGIIGDGSQGSCYTQADLDALDAVPGKVVLDALSVDEAIVEVLRHQPDFGYYIDPATEKCVFVDFATLVEKILAGVDDAVIEQSLDWTTAGCFTACTVEGSREMHDVYDGSLIADWDTDLESSWTPKLAADYPNTYGKVYRYFKLPTADAEGGVAMQQRCVGSGQLLCAILWRRWDADPDSNNVLDTMPVFTQAKVVDDTHIMLFDLAYTFKSTWNDADSPTSSVNSVQTCQVAAQYTYAKDVVSGRYPAASYEGTAYTNRSLEREKFITQEERCKRVIDTEVAEVYDTTHFRTPYPLLATLTEDELIGLKVAFNDGPQYEIDDNGICGHWIRLSSEPAVPVAVDDTVQIIVQDDTELIFDGDTVSILQKYAEEFVKRHSDERFSGRIPLTGLDYSIALGQKINFSGTDNAAYAALDAILLEVEHDIAHGRMSIALTNERADHGASWGLLEAERRRDREIEEARTQIHRLWGRQTRKGDKGHHAAPAADDPSNPSLDVEVGDGRTRVHTIDPHISEFHWFAGRSRVYTIQHTNDDVTDHYIDTRDYPILKIDAKNHVIGANAAGGSGSGEVAMLLWDKGAVFAEGPRPDRRFEA